MKKFFVGLLIICGLIAASSYWWTIHGSWLDRSVSFLISRKLHVNVRVRHVEIKRWSNLSFDSLVVTSNQGESWINTDEGEIAAQPLFFFSKPPRALYFHFKHVIVFSAFYSSKGGLTIPFALPKWLEDSLVINEIRWRMMQNHSRMGVQILDYHSPSLGLRGGVRFEGKQIHKMHVVISASDELLRRLPGILRSRLLTVSNGWQGARIIYCNHVLTAIGHQGPFFKFQWQGSA